MLGVSSFASVKSKKLAQILLNPALLDLKIESQIKKETIEQNKQKQKSLDALIKGYEEFKNQNFNLANEQFAVAAKNTYVDSLAIEQTGYNIGELAQICEDIFLSSEIIFDLKKENNDCRSCKGRGYLPCKKCKGFGSVDKDSNLCKRCAGVGLLICSDCEGVGVNLESSLLLESKNTITDPKLLKIENLIKIARYLSNGGPDFFTKSSLEKTPSIAGVSHENIYRRSWPKNKD